MKPNQDLIESRQAVEKVIQDTHKKSFWKLTEDVFGALFICILCLILLIGIVYFFITLIENPVSLAILCITLSIIYCWSAR
jgi:hypothetical protein